MLTGEPALVSAAAGLLVDVLQHNEEALPRLYTSGGQRSAVVRPACSPRLPPAASPRLLWAAPPAYAPASRLGLNKHTPHAPAPTLADRSPPAQTRTPGAFFFALAYCGSNLQEISALLRVAHLRQQFRGPQDLQQVGGGLEGGGRGAGAGAGSSGCWPAVQGPL
jgi:hypothetical protein